MISVGFAGKNLINKYMFANSFLSERESGEMHLGSGVEKKRKKTFPMQLQQQSANYSIKIAFSTACFSFCFALYRHSSLDSPWRCNLHSAS